jgi:hypothetical protein
MYKSKVFTFLSTQKNSPKVFQTFGSFFFCRVQVFGEVVAQCKQKLVQLQTKILAFFIRGDLPALPPRS